MGNSYTVCSETDGEDNSCSDSISDLHFVFQNGGVVHTHYFDVDISTFGGNSCAYTNSTSNVPPQEASSSTTSFNIAIFLISLISLYFKA
uniref:Uncharacterized protein n=1 Tax=Acrobeloides nanus TaxID=290746 RepID=A0A914DKA2_9BILA